MAPGTKGINFNDSLQALEKEDFVSAVFHFIEMTDQNSQSQHCQARISLAHFQYNFSKSDYKQFEGHALTATKVANILNNLNLGPKRESETHLLKEQSFYIALSRASMMSDTSIFSNGIALSKTSSFHNSLFAPFAYRTADGHSSSAYSSDIVVKDIAPSFNYSYDSSSTPGADWFWKQQQKNFTDIFRSRYGGEYDEIYSSIFNGSKNIVTTLEDGVWSVPYYDCGGSSKWIVSYSAPFFELEDSNINLSFTKVIVSILSLLVIGINLYFIEDYMVTALPHHWAVYLAVAIGVVIGKYFPVPYTFTIEENSSTDVENESSTNSEDTEESLDTVKYRKNSNVIVRAPKLT
ncbi:hypothetical protein GQR58_008314 [Nymphon striatum]|nr:hypothetical protein GQR58_008314 [Nymphon striatum]